MCALILSASMLLSCGSRRKLSTEVSQQQSQQRSELAVNHAEQHLRDTTLEEWEILLLDTISPRQGAFAVGALAGDSLLAVSRSQMSGVRYIRARRTVVRQQDSVARKEEALQQANSQQEATTERQTAERRPSWLTGLLVWVVGSLLLVVGVATLMWILKRRWRW
ncbi:hypothetical protein PORUE0001_1788 [Porphyromonas uenonis 60-3]|uniref:Uncharacterized protein n=1 Tax=Porphyromonas uenonis 60-3 TaxID=596327 RepID=C2MCV6_9PORP|nr:hypothetical protein PORUE0001_1788 [Porphyromonas uenonis 60-3]